MSAQVTIKLDEYLELKEMAEKAKSVKTILLSKDDKGSSFIISTDDDAVAELMRDFEITKMNLARDNEIMLNVIDERDRIKESIAPLKKENKALQIKLNTIKENINNLF
jgi:hypothetical protein